MVQTLWNLEEGCIDDIYQNYSTKLQTFWLRNVTSRNLHDKYTCTCTDTWTWLFCTTAYIKANKNRNNLNVNRWLAEYKSQHMYAMKYYSFIRMNKDAEGIKWIFNVLIFNDLHDIWLNQKSQVQNSVESIEKSICMRQGWGYICFFIYTCWNYICRSWCKSGLSGFTLTILCN